MSKTWLRVGRSALYATTLLIASELLLPYFYGLDLDAPPRAAQRARAFHRALYCADLATMERLRPHSLVIQSAHPAHGSQAPAKGEPGIEIRINAAGMRMRECTPQRRPHVRRIAVLGDSVSFGWRVAEEACWPRQLEVALRTAGHSVEVLNFACPGYTTLQAVAQFRTQVLAFAPDLVILATGFNDAWLRPGWNDRERLRGAAETSQLQHLLFEWRRNSAIARAWRRTWGLPEPGGSSSSTAALQRRAPPFDVTAALSELLELARRHDVEVMLFDLCLPHARNGDVQRAFAARHELPFCDGRASLGVAAVAATPLAAPRTLHVRLDSGMRARWESGQDALLALAFPPDHIESVRDLDTRALERVGAHAELELKAGDPRDWAIVPRSYLEAAGTSNERWMTLVYHRVSESEAPAELRVGRFEGAAYDCTDAEHAPYAHGEAIHPNAEGHARLARTCAEFLRAQTALLRSRQP